MGGRRAQRLVVGPSQSAFPDEGLRLGLAWEGRGGPTGTKTALAFEAALMAQRSEPGPTGMLATARSIDASTSRPTRLGRRDPTRSLATTSPRGA